MFTLFAWVFKILNIYILEAYLLLFILYDFQNQYHNIY